MKKEILAEQILKDILWEKQSGLKGWKLTKAYMERLLKEKDKKEK